PTVGCAVFAARQPFSLLHRARPAAQCNGLILSLHIPPGARVELKRSQFWGSQTRSSVVCVRSSYLIEEMPMLRNRMNELRMLWWGMGAFCGLAIGGLLPMSPLHATATDRQESFAMATGMIEGGFEAIYTLDFLTGDLRGVLPAFNN